MWWSPDSRKLAYYRFDEKPVPDFFLQMNQTQVQDTLDVEAYPKPGKPNPIVDLFVYDVVAKKTTRIDVRDGKPFDNDAIGHYVYNITWSPDGKDILLNRTNRKQNILEFAACSPETGKCRAIVHEEWPTSWIENRPEMRFLKDGKRFIWESQRNGFKNFYLYDLSGKLIAPLSGQTAHEADNIVMVDEARGFLFYTARDGDNFMKLQLHRVGLDGKNDKRLTDPAFNHTVSASPDGKYFVDVGQTHDIPPVTPPHRQQRQGDRRAREERHVEVRRARPEEGRDVHLPGGRRQDRAPRADSLPVEFRSVEEVSVAGRRLRRPGVGRDQRALHDAEPDDRVRLPRAPARLARRARAWASARSTRST